MQRFTIGRLASEAGVTVETVRYYERRGLLAQPPKPAVHGYREYSDRNLKLIRHIKLGKELGLQLAEIRGLIDLLGTDREFCLAFQKLVARKMSAVREEQDRLRKIEAKLTETLAACTARDPEGECPIQARLVLA